MYSRDIVAFTATLSTIGLFCTGIPICYKIVRTGSTAESSFFPLMVMFISSVLWTKYGLLKADTALFFVNSAGALMSINYIIIFYIYTTPRKAIHRQLVLGTMLLFPSLVFVKLYALNHDDALFYMGYTCGTASIISYGSPLSAVAEVISTKSTASMAFPLSLANFLVALQWFIYGSQLKDYFIQVPNALGIVLGLVQLTLFCKYPQQKSTLPGRTVSM